MQQRHMHKAVTRDIQEKELLSRRRQSDYSQYTSIAEKNSTLLIFALCNTYLQTRAIMFTYYQHQTTQYYMIVSETKYEMTVAPQRKAYYDQCSPLQC